MHISHCILHTRIGHKPLHWQLHAHWSTTVYMSTNCGFWATLGKAELLSHGGALWPKFWFEHIATVICTYVESNLHSVQGRNSIQGFRFSISLLQEHMTAPLTIQIRTKKEKFQEQIRNQILRLLWWDLKISSPRTTYNHHKTWHRTLGVVLVRSIFILA